MPLPVIQIPASRDTTITPKGEVNLGDANYPDEIYTEGHAPRPVELDATDPGYTGPDSRIIEQRPSPLPSYEFANPSPGKPGSSDRMNCQDIGGVPGTDYLNYKDGPVRGFAMDSEPTFAHQELVSRPPGQFGPVVGGEDYSTLVANAAYQEAFAQYSTAPSDQAIVGAI